MSDYEILKNKIKESLANQNSEIPDNIDLTVDENPTELPQPEEVSDFAPAPEEPEIKEEIPAPAEVQAEEDSPLERLDLSALQEDAEDIIPASKEKKKHSMFRRSYVESPEGETDSAEIKTFADRYARKNTADDDSAFGKFTAESKKNKFAAAKKHEPTAKEAAVLDNLIKAADNKDTPEELPVIGEGRSEEIKFPSIVEMRAKTAEKNGTKEFSGVVGTSPVNSDDDDDDTVKISDKSEILSQLATADSGDLRPEEIARIDEEVAENMSLRQDSIKENAEADKKQKEKKKFGNPFSEENLKNWRLRFDHLDASLNRSACKPCNSFEELPSLKKTLSHERKILLIRAAVMAFLALVTAVMNLIATVSANKNGGKFAVFGGSNIAYGLVMLVMLILGAVVMLPELRSGVCSLLKLKPKTATMLTCAYIAAFIQAFWSVITAHLIESEYHVLVAAALAVSVPVLIGKDYYSESFGILLRHCETGENVGVLRDVEKPATVAEMLRDDASSGKTIRYPGLARFLEGMTECCADAPASAEIRGRVDAIFGIASVIAGIIGAIGGHSIIFGITALTACLCVSVPVSSVVAGGRKIREINKSYSKIGLHIASFGEAKQAVASENIVVNDDDIFTATIEDQIIARQISVPQAELIAAMLAQKAGGVLARIFEAQIFENGDKFAPITEFTCENRLGVSGWLTDCKILLGNKTFMENHSIAIPSEYIEANLSSELKKLYLSINGTFVCCFALQYSPIESVKKDLQMLVRQGTNLIILATDPNLTDDAIEKMLSFPADSVRVLTAGNLEDFCETRKTPLATAQAGFAFRPGFSGFVSAIGQAVKLNEMAKILNTVTICGAAAGLVLCLIFALTGVKEGLSVWFTVLIQVLSCFAAIFIPEKLRVSVNRQARIRPVKMNRQKPHSVENTEKARQNINYNDYEEAVAEMTKPAAEPAPVYVAVNEMDFDYSRYGVSSDSGNFEEDEEFAKLLEYMDKPQHIHTRIERKTFSDRMKEKFEGMADKARSRRAPEAEEEEKPVDYYNSGNISTGEEYDFVGKYRGENMFRGLNEE